MYFFLYIKVNFLLIMSWCRENMLICNIPVTRHMKRKWFCWPKRSMFKYERLYLINFGAIPPILQNTPSSITGHSLQYYETLSPGVWNTSSIDKEHSLQDYLTLPPVLRNTPSNITKHSLQDYGTLFPVWWNTPSSITGHSIQL